MPASSQRRRHLEGATIICHPRRRARPALPREGEELHVRPVPRWAARGLVPARCGAGGAQGRGGTGRHLRRRAAPRCNIHAARRVIQPRTVAFFFVDPRRHGYELARSTPRTAPIRGRRDLLGPHAERWHAIDAPRLGTRPVYPTRAPPTPSSTRHLPPPVAQKVGTRSHNNDNITRPATPRPATATHAATKSSSRNFKHSARAFKRALSSNAAN